MNGDKQSEEELGLNFCQTLMEIVQQKSIFIFNIKLYKMCCSGCSTVDRAFEKMQAAIAEAVAAGCLDLCG